VAEQLIPFTGYYTLDADPGTFGPGAFFLIDTNLHYLNDGGVVSRTYTATVTISLDGKSSNVFDASCCTFENRVLTVYNGEPGQAGEAAPSMVAEVALYKEYCNGNSSALIGTIQAIDAIAVKGVTPFSAVHFPMWVAEYFVPQPVDAPIEVAPSLVIKADESVWYLDNTGKLVQVPGYTYNYAMFVIGFTLPEGSYEFEMGTVQGMGRVAGNSAGGGGLLVSIPSYPLPPTT